MHQKNLLSPGAHNLLGPLSSITDGREPSLHLHTGFRLAFLASFLVSSLPCTSFLSLELITGFLVNKVCDFYLNLAETIQLCILKKQKAEPIRKMAKSSSKCLEKIILNMEIYTTWT